MKRTLRALLATAVVALALPAWAETFNVSIVQTNDIDRMEESGGQGGFAKLAKLAQGALDLHSARSRVDFTFLAELLADQGAPKALCDAALQANTAKEVLDLSLEGGIDLSTPLARKAKAAVLEILRGAPVAVEVLIVDRSGHLTGETGWDD